MADNGRNLGLLLGILFLQSGLQHLIVVSEAILVLGSDDLLRLSSLLSTATLLGLEHQEVSIV
jgi:hypothetical protein